jgi:putative FmdB family regulatory protein
MPTYEYLCQSCSHRFETWQKMTDEPLTTCPECKGHIRRVLFPAGVIFKGPGFYKTDHGNGALPSPNGANGEAKTSSETTSATSSSGETKASSKSEGSAKSTPASAAAD